MQEWVAIPFSRGSFQPKDRTQISCIAQADSFPSEPPGKLHSNKPSNIPSSTAHNSTSTFYIKMVTSWMFPTALITREKFLNYFSFLGFL